jgi:hypothetical protein
MIDAGLRTWRGARFALLLACWPLVSIGEDSPLRSLGVDAECERQVEQMSGSTAYSQKMESVRKSCFARYVSAACDAQLNAAPAAHRDASCLEQLGTAMRACGKEMLDASTRYARKQLGAKCGAQWAAALQKGQQKQIRCEEEMSRRSEQVRRCVMLATPQEQNACMASMTKDDAACAR